MAEQQQSKQKKGINLDAIELQFRKWHDVMEKAVYERMDSLDEKFHTSIEKLFSMYEEQYDKLNNRLERLSTEIHQKSEMDSAIIAQLQNMKERVEKSESFQESVIKLGAKVDQILEQLNKNSPFEMQKDLKNAHVHLRNHDEILEDHSTRINDLEDHPGKLAISKERSRKEHMKNLRNMIIASAITFFGTVGASVLLWWLTGGL